MRLVILAAIVSIGAGNLDEVDRNNDGIIDESEYPVLDSIPFDMWPVVACTVDKNRDGKMQLDEFKVLFTEEAPSPKSQEATRCQTQIWGVAEADRNNDGIIEESEYPEYLSNRTFFACTVDQNGDGKMQTDELLVLLTQIQLGKDALDPSFKQELIRCATQQRQQQQIEQLLADVDQNNNGFLEESEFPSPLEAGKWEAIVCGVDKNGDGKVGLDEFKPIFSKMVQGDESYIQDHVVTCVTNTFQQQQASFDLPKHASQLAAVDQNNNGFLEKSEYPSALQAGQWEAMVCGIDKNGDGKIGLDEFKPVFMKIIQGDTSVFQEIGDTCASKKQQQQHGQQQREQTPAHAGSSNSATQSANVQQQQQGQQQQGQQQQEQPPEGSSNSVSINMVLFTLASLMVMIWK